MYAMKVMKKNFFKNYLENFNTILTRTNYKSLIILAKIILKHHRKKGRIIIAGNGGSASIAAHICVDLNKELSIKAINFNESNLITCFANDYGYENWLKKALEIFCDKNDLVILISSSGNSPNIINAANYIKKKKIGLITFSGFSKNNKLKKIGLVNFWCQSNSYNFIEMSHYIWLVSVVDFLKKFHSKK
jgi:D-sedoheptulose 7-phosphate isomerase